MLILDNAEFEKNVSRIFEFFSSEFVFFVQIPSTPRNHRKCVLSTVLQLEKTDVFQTRTFEIVGNKLSSPNYFFSNSASLVVGTHDQIFRSMTNGITTFWIYPDRICEAFRSGFLIFTSCKSSRVKKNVKNFRV